MQKAEELNLAQPSEIGNIGGHSKMEIVVLKVNEMYMYSYTLYVHTLQLESLVIQDEVWGYTIRK